MNNNDWTEDIEIVLEHIRINSVLLSKEHKKKYFYYKHIQRYFKLPSIILSAISSIVSVGLQPYLEQGQISITTCLLSLSVSVIGSIELYMGIQRGIESELLSQQQYYLLAVDIYKNLLLSKEHRPIPAKEYLDRCYNEYVKLIENSDTLAKKIEDKLAIIPLGLTSNSSSVKLPPTPLNIEIP